LPDSCMNKGVLRCITWSNWAKVLTPNLPTDKSKSKFMKSRTQNGYALKDWFHTAISEPAMYEFAVQYGEKGSCKKYVMYFRMRTMGSKRAGSWSSNLIFHKTVRKEVDEALKQGCCIFARQGTVKGRKKTDKARKLCKVADYVGDHYDYAWSKYIWRKTKGGVKMKHRHFSIRKKGTTVHLSHNEI